MQSVIQCDGNGILHGNNEGVSYVEGERNNLIPQGTGRNMHILYSGRIQDLVFLIQCTSPVSYNPEWWT